MNSGYRTVLEDEDGNEVFFTWTPVDDVNDIKHFREHIAQMESFVFSNGIYHFLHSKA